MKLVVMQPTYLPWTGYFDLIDQSDVFVFYDNVQFEKQSWQQRNRIKTAQGVQWLTVPVFQSLGQRIDAVRINNGAPWRHKHWMALVTNYSRAPFFGQYAPLFRSIYERSWESLSSMNVDIVTMLAKALGVESHFLRGSSLPVFGGQKEEPLSALAAYLGATTYLSPSSASAYLTCDELFRRQGIAVEFHAYEHPVWPQQFGPFVPYLSVVDLLFHCGPEARTVLREGRRASTPIKSEEARALLEGKQ